MRRGRKGGGDRDGGLTEDEENETRAEGCGDEGEWDEKGGGGGGGGGGGTPEGGMPISPPSLLCP
eukprot:2040407-Pyramimonas_sp.AAC.1